VNLLLTVFLVSCTHPPKVSEDNSQVPSTPLKVTLNDMGVEGEWKNPISEAFLDDVEGKTVLEIGAAYGALMEQALKRSAKEYHANDIDDRHLAEALEKIPKDFKGVVKTYPGIYPAKVHLSAGFYDAVVVVRVLHFLNPESLKAMLQDIHRVLKPGGKAYVVAWTPFNNHAQKFIPEYHRRVATQQAYPGYVESLLPWAPEGSTCDSFYGFYCSSFLFLESRELANAFANQGFVVQKAFDFSSRAWHLDGKEAAGIIAQKM
jgi:SAM-dependent methyltransferase